MFAQELARFDVASPIESAETPPSSWYLRPEFHDAEVRQVLLNSWQPAALRCQLVESGDYVSGEFCGQPYVVTRAADGQIRAFYNVCRHHASLIVEGKGCQSQLTCPYHGWTYDLDGRLRKAPRLGAVKEFNRDDYGLKPIPSALWGPWVWLHFGDKPNSLEEQLAPLARRLDPEGLSRLQFVERRSYDLECNWKVYVDNYLDGGYHVEVAHKALASQLDLEQYQTTVESPWVMQVCGGGSSERLEGGAVYAWLYPNWMLNRYGPMMDTNWVIPLGPERCRTVFDYFFVDASDPDFVARSLAASHQVQLEDVAICESVQRGLRSRGYEVGRYAPALEIGEFAFHQWLASDLRRT
jgi:choline monooxygenase